MHLAWSIGTGLALSVGTLSLAAAGPAEASDTPATVASVACRGFNYETVIGDGDDDVRIRTSPNTGAGVVGYAYRSNTLCWDGPPRNGFSYGSVYGPSGLRGTGWVSRTYLRPDV
ncbi:hypothetical protein [Amycolatopsis saalfeldensis]|uniref:SH3 domain-containing protein n=1 Tax=Amycolatopsis saalfeldensis TaxID=394193 RepID=A0A1H8YRJ3_9PSEU|nr:hypothetical protein [Amycolatopsis saalfeldensis]SEP53998.1 hypothetical protein SAMN04489732_13453 [Amycolatopsis saalfeldensis]